MTTHEQNLLRRAERCRRANEYAHDQTRQRRFEQSFLSADCCPDEVGDPYDYGDCGRSARRMFREIDAPVVERIRELRFAAAIEAVPKEWRKMLRLIRQGVPRITIWRLCRISRATYFRRLEAMRLMFERTA